MSWGAPCLAGFETWESWGRSFVGSRHSQVSQLQRDLGHPLLKLGFIRRLEGVGTPGSRNIGETRGTPRSRLIAAVALHRFWQARFYDFTVWTEQKRIEKL